MGPAVVQGAREDVRGPQHAPRGRHVGSLRPRRAAAPRRVESGRLPPDAPLRALAGFLLIWLEHIDEDEVRERLIDGWLIQAPKRLAAQHAPTTLRGRDCFLARQAARDDLRDAVAAHRHAVQHVGGLHRPLLVRDDDELRAVGVPAEELDEAADVRVVERGLDLVEQVERARPREEEREQERDRAERLLAAREQREARDLLAGRPKLDLDPGSPSLLLGLGRAAAGPRRRGTASRRRRRSAAPLREGLVKAALERLGQLAAQRLQLVRLASRSARW